MATGDMEARRGQIAAGLAAPKAKASPKGPLTHNMAPARMAQPAHGMPGAVHLSASRGKTVSHVVRNTQGPVSPNVGGIEGSRGAIAAGLASPNPGRPVIKTTTTVPASPNPGRAGTSTFRSPVQEATGGIAAATNPTGGNYLRRVINGTKR